MKKTKGVWGGGLLLLTTCLAGCEVAEVFPNAEPRERKITDNYEYYEYVPAAKKTDLLLENFYDNRRGWRVVSYSSTTQYSTRIVDGDLEIDNRASSPQQNSIDFPELKGTDNFEIETWIRLIYSNGAYVGNGNGLLWGLKAAAPGQWLYYGIHDNYSKMAVGAYDGQRYQVENPLTSRLQTPFYQGGYNTFMVRKVNNTCYYFLNGELLTKQTAAPFYGSRIGFGADAYSTVRVGFLRVSRLNLN